MPLLLQRRRLVGPIIGRIRETRDMLDLCATEGLASQTEVIPIQQIHEAQARVLGGNVHVRVAIDLASLAQG